MKKRSSDSVIRDLAEYYTDKIVEHGATPRGVDWNGIESQSVRFEQLLKLFPSDHDADFSVSDLGCGYAAFYHLLRLHYGSAKYQGYDISQAMVDEANRILDGELNASASLSSGVIPAADYAVASGIFSVKLESSNHSWLEHIFETLDEMDRACRRGFAFNCLTSYSDRHLQRSDLYYADPLYIFDHCKRRFSKNVAILHDYDLYEFTILVRK